MKTDYLQIFISFGITKLATNHSLRVSHFPQNNKVLRKVSSKMVLIDWNHDLWQFKYEIDNHLLFRRKMWPPTWQCQQSSINSRISLTRRPRWPLTTCVSDLLMDHQESSHFTRVFYIGVLFTSVFHIGVFLVVIYKQCVLFCIVVT